MAVGLSESHLNRLKGLKGACHLRRLSNVNSCSTLHIGDECFAGEALHNESPEIYCRVQFAPVFVIHTVESELRIIDNATCINYEIYTKKRMIILEDLDI
jgi:hypothetical protein